ncbi:MAG TPA: thioesterase family protein [Candidatus Elarobacter sp.]|nr:thioesterase family protein [Candidatus Elarobacter sp.]
MTRTRVRFGETDAAGIVFYPTFFAWFDVGATGLLRAASGAMLGAEGRPRWPVPIVEAGASFSAPLYYDDAIAIRTTVVDVGSSSLRLEHVVVRGETEAARGFEVRVYVGYVDGGIRARTIPDDLRRALAEETSSEDEVA